MQFKHYALTAMASAVVAMSAQAQTSYPGSATPSQVNTPSPTETQSGQVPSTQPSLPGTEPSPASQPSTIVVVPAAPSAGAIIVEKPGVTTAATRDGVRTETLNEMKAGHIPRGEQSTATQGSKPEFTGSEMLWQRDPALR